MNTIDELLILQLGPEIEAVAAEIMYRAILPAKGQVDALHIATAAHHRRDYLLTWNCTHIANARILPRIQQVLVDLNCWIQRLRTFIIRANASPTTSAATFTRSARTHESVKNSLGVELFRTQNRLTSRTSGTVYHPLTFDVSQLKYR
jgi:hypothetical protein